MKAKRFFNGVLRVLFPPSCAACRELGEEPLCETCRAALKKAYSPRKVLCKDGNGFADSVFALFSYHDKTARKLVLALKNEGHGFILDGMMPYFEKALPKMPSLADVDAITFCPRSPRRARFFGFDQARLLAERLSPLLNMPFRPLLSRSIFSVVQHHTGRTERRFRNVKGKFFAREKLNGESILLIDDVVTSGATVSAAAQALKNAGAMHVYVLCFAH